MDIILSILIRIIVFFSRFSKPLAKLGIGSYEEWKEGEKLRLLLVGYNGARNTGADARVSAIVKQMKDLFGEENIQITVMTLNRKLLDGYFAKDVSLLEFSSIFLLDLYQACCIHHAAIICEGSTLKSTFANALTMFFCEASGIMARQGKPCIAYGSEVGAMEPLVERLSAKLCRDTYFITRTEESQQALEALGLQGHIGTDTAWFYDDAISKESAGQMLQQAGWDGKMPLLGIAVIDPFCWPVRASLKKWIKGILTGNMEGRYDRWYFYSESRDRRAAFARYIGSIAEAVLRYQEEQDVFPVLIGMEKMDVRACRALRKKLNQPCAMFCSGDNSADIMAGILQRLSMLVTSRYHAAVLSMESGIPIVAISMDERIDAIMRELSFADRYLHHVADNDLAVDLYHSMINAERNREEISAHILEARRNYQEKLAEMGSFLKSYMDRRLV